MADVWYKSGTITTPASGTTVIGSLPGTNPKFIHIWWANNTSDNTVQAHQQAGHGFSDGVDHDCMTVTAQDGANLNERDARNANWCLISDPTSTGTDIILGSTVAMNTSDVTLSYTTTTSGRILNYEIWGGAGVTANMIQYGSAVANSPVSHGLGSKPDLVLVITAGQAHPASSIHSYLSFGVANDNGSSIDQWNLHSFFGDSDTDFVGSALTLGDIAGQYDSDFADWDSTVTAISTTTVTWTETAAPGADQNIMATLNFQGDGAVGVKVGMFTKATASAPTTQAMPTFGFTPMGYALASANYTSSAKPGTNTDRIAHRSFGAYDGTTQVSALTIGTPASNADRASITRNNEVLQGSPALQATGVDWSGTAQAITDATPDIEWNPNTTDAVQIGFYGIEEQVSIANLTPTQTEASEAQAVTPEVIVDLAPAQTETAEANAVTVNPVVQITAAQNEVTEGQSVSVEVIAATANVTAAQTEASESQAVVAEVLIDLTPAQTEGIESQGVNIEALVNLLATQTELTESQIALIQSVVELTAAQTELPESQSALVENVIELTIAQTEASDVNVASVISPTTEQEGYRFRNDDGTEITATWRENQDTVTVETTGVTVRLRILVNADGDPSSHAIRLEDAKDGVDEWRAIN